MLSKSYYIDIDLTKKDYYYYYKKGKTQQIQGLTTFSTGFPQIDKPLKSLKSRSAAQTAD